MTFYIEKSSLNFCAKNGQNGKTKYHANEDIRRGPLVAYELIRRIL